MTLEVRVGEETREVRGEMGGGCERAGGGDRAEARNCCRPLTEHPINALWARFTGVKDWDGPELRAKLSGWAKAAAHGPRLGDESSHGAGLVVLDHSAEGRRREHRAGL